MSTGLAWTEAGGDVLYVEASLLPGAARPAADRPARRRDARVGARRRSRYVWSHAEALGIDPHVFRHTGVHIHVPAGATPKDGPSAGVTMVDGPDLALHRLPVRSDTAMTGEITLTGLVLPVGGIKEKVLAARRAGMRQVILPKDNEKDLRELPDGVREEMDFVFAERIEDVLAAALPGVARRLEAASLN